MKFVTQAATFTALALFGIASAAYAQSGGSSGGGSGSAGGAAGGTSAGGSAGGGANGSTGMGAGTGSATSGSGATASPGTTGYGSSTANSPTSMPGTSGAVGDDKIDRTNRGTSSSSVNTPPSGEPTGMNNPSISRAPDTAPSTPGADGRSAGHSRAGRPGEMLVLVLPDRVRPRSGIDTTLVSQAPCRLPPTSLFQAAAARSWMRNVNVVRSGEEATVRVPSCARAISEAM